LETVTLKRKQNDGSVLQAIFAPEKGMNLMSLKKEKVEVIDQSTLELFEERAAGLGALIGPHFYHLREDLIPPPPKEGLFPHILKLKAKGQKDLFSHGIARYVPWKYQATETTISAKLASVDQYEGYLLSQLEGLNFYMSFEAELLEDGLRIHITSNSDLFSVVGLHYYYAMTPASVVEAKVEKRYNDMGTFKPMPTDWLDNNGHLHLLLDKEIDAGFLPKENTNFGKFTLTTADYQLEVKATPQEDSELSFQIYHPADASFVCIEPISATNPRGELPKQGNLIIDIKISDLPNQNG
jgi:hypothetical protein